MNDLETAFSLQNLRRAYRWLLSNPDARYKNLFRDSYSAYALASDSNLKSLRQDLLNERYEPSHASKLYLPKPSGLLRPITLLTTDDQIIYQACVNVISDKLLPLTRKRYRKRVFSHLYAGRKSQFFYLKWQDSYRAFSRSIRRLHADRFSHVANFDLTSFYDSIDHNVLRHFMAEIGVDVELIEFLAECLRIWTSSTWSNRSNIIYLRHGIPQGPLSSGMLSEVVLMHIDETGERGRRTRYLRYVDDIKILARQEQHLRQKLIALDLCSKEIGLFPQTSKINIRRLDDPEKEIRSVSRPPEPSIGPTGSQKDLRRRLLEMTRGSKVAADLSTRFKYLLSHAVPHSALNIRLLNLIENQPEYSELISPYFAKYSKLPSKAARKMIDIIRRSELYHSVHGDILRAVIDNMQPPERDVVATLCYERLLGAQRLDRLEPQPTYKESLIAWVIRWKKISFSELEKLTYTETDWWVRKSTLKELDLNLWGASSSGVYINTCVRHSERELARIAAAVMVERSVTLKRPHGDVNPAAKLSFRASGTVKSVGRPPSLLNVVLKYVLNRRNSTYDWKRLLGSKHKSSERIVIMVKQKFEVDIDACIVRLDSLCDLILEELVSRITPGSGYGYGSILNSPNQSLQNSVPTVLAGFKALHDLRLSSFTAHPRSQKTGAPTRRLKHVDYRKVRPILVQCFDEIEAQIVP